MALRLTSRGRARGASLRGSGALLAVAVTAGLTTHVTSAVAEEPADSGAEAYLADLVGRVSDAQDQVSELETQLGGLRESVNKSRVDFDRSTREAVDAQNAVTDARGRLGGTQDDLDTAQSDLDEIARSAYTQGGDSSPVPLASATSADDAIDRSTYIRMAAEQQQAKVDRLDLARTQAANEESRLRDARDAADDSVTAAQDAQGRAEAQLDQVTAQLSEKSEAHRKLLDQAQSAREQLAAARAAVDRVSRSNAGASSFDKRNAAEEAVAAVPATRSGDTAGAGEAGTAQDAPQADTKARVTTTPQTTTAAPATTAAGTTAGTDQDQSTQGASDQDMTATTDASAASDQAESDQGTSTAQGGPSEDAGDTGASGLPSADGSDGSGDADSASTGSFTHDEAGDDLRQAAIDGLLGAAGAAVDAGAGAALNGQNPVRAARTAARGAAAESYADLPVGGNGSGVGEDAGAGDGTDGDLTGGTEGTDSADGTDGTSTGDASGDSDGSLLGDLLGGGNGNSGTTGNTGDTSSPDESGTTEQKIERVIDRGMTQLGVTYSWGGGNWYGPTLGIRDGGVADSYGDYNKVGFDCSGLMMYAFYAVGIQLDHYSGYQYTSGTQVPVDQAKRGDMLFWGIGGASHVALYLGDGKMLEAPQSGSTVQVSDVRWSGIEPYATRMIE